MAASGRSTVITSTTNARVKGLVRLQQARARRQTGTYLIEGQHPVTEALADGVVTEVWIDDPTGDRLDRFVPRDLRATVEVVHTDATVLRRISDTTTTQGVVAVGRFASATLAEVVGTGWLLVLEAIADPGNLGTLVRTADALGATGVVLTPGSVDPTNPKVVRAAAGSLTHLPIVVDATVVEVAAACGAVGQRLVGLAGEGALDVRAAGLQQRPVALVGGSEAHGLSAAARAACDVLAAIPHTGRAESLNLAAAVAVAAWETVR